MLNLPKDKRDLSIIKRYCRFYYTFSSAQETKSMSIVFVAWGSRCRHTMYHSCDRSVNNIIFTAYSLYHIIICCYMVNFNVSFSLALYTLYSQLKGIIYFHHSLISHRLLLNSLDQHSCSRIMQQYYISITDEQVRVRTTIMLQIWKLQHVDT